MADNKNRQIAQEVLQAVGGSKNISSVTHCMTRLRFILKDQTIPDDKVVKSIKGVVGVNISNGQYQVIIGNSVGSVYKELVDLGGVSETASTSKDEPAAKKNYVAIALDFISACMTPLFPALIAGGLLKVILVVLSPTVLGLMETTSDTYIIINALGDSPFYFLPIVVAYAAARKLGCNSGLAVMVASMLIYPDLITLLGGDAATRLFGVIPVAHGSYSASIIPAMLSTVLLAQVERFIDRITPDWAKNFFKPFLIVAITAPITLCLFAPIGLFLGNGLNTIVSVVYNVAPWLAITLVSAAMPFIVMTGMHWALLPATLNSLASLGYDVLLIPTMLASNTAQAGATFGVAFKTKDKDLRSMAIPAGISALLAGVTEPAMYGVTLPLKQPMIAACIASGIGGLIAGLTALKGYVFATPCLTAIVQFISPDGGMNFVFAIVVFVASFISSLVLSWFLYKDKETSEDAASDDHPETTAQATSSTVAAQQEQTIIVPAPIKGEIIPLSEVKDEAFAAGMMGEGYGIIPAEGKVYAPCDGTCEAVFPTLHALGLTLSNGVELLIHVGLDTVTLEGKPFQAHIASGQTFKKGDLLLEFDIEAIKNAGLEIQTPVLVSNADAFKSVNIEDGQMIVQRF